MSKAIFSPKITLSAPQTIPLDKLSVHEANVRQIKACVSIERLAADIARRCLLQSLSARPLFDIGPGRKLLYLPVSKIARTFRAE